MNMYFFCDLILLHLLLCINHTPLQESDEKLGMIKITTLPSETKLWQTK